MKTTILIVEDDASQRRYLSALLKGAGHGVREAAGGTAALDILLGPEAGALSLVLLDLHMPDVDGLEVLKRARQAGLGLPVLVLTSDGSIARAVEAMQAGATDFLAKPVGPERLEVTIRNALQIGTLSSEVRRLTKISDNRLSFDELIADAPATKEAIKLARRAARTDIPVLILGESGTGKEVFARAIHGESERAGGPFVAVNCGALPAMLVESILFGHEKGAFTGATSRAEGKFAQASGGTLFLDEVGDLPAETQVKLLRAIQQGEVDPVGASAPVKVDIRLVSATNRDLGQMVEAGTFREDLYYRISVFPLTLPPLRERREDLERLAAMFLARFSASEEIPVDGFAQEAIDAILAAPWPGNVRQLENIVHRAVVLADSARIVRADLRGLEGAGRSRPPVPVGAERDVSPPAAGREGPEAAKAQPFLGPDGHARDLAALEKEAIRAALTRYRGAMSESARRLGIGRSTLYRKIEEYGIDVGEL